MKILDELMALDHFEGISLAPNLYKIKSAYLGVDDESASLFNKIYDWCVQQEKDGILTRFIFTKSGGISIAKGKFSPPCWNYKKTNKGISLIIVLAVGSWNIHFETKPKIEKATTDNLYPNQCFARFKDTCAKHGIDLEKDAIPNGLEVKKTIEKTLIYTPYEGSCSKYITHENCHHIDFHSSFMGGLAITHPEYKPVVDEIYDKRKQDPAFKALLNITQGYFQSKYVDYRFAGLTRDMIKNNNDRVRELAARVEAAGGVILNYNTDGFWYHRDTPYHGEGESDRPGTWSNDHTYCQLRMKSAGSYEYIEDGKYYPVVRGSTRLDRVKPRDEWEWGDIFQEDANILSYYWDDGLYSYDGGRL